MSCFLIKSKMNGMVMDVKKESRVAGAEVIMFPEHREDNQLWYDDEDTGTIRSKLNDFCLDLDNEVLVCRPYEEESYTQKWKRDGNFIRNRNSTKKVLDILGENKKSGARIGAYDFHGKANQQWDFIMVLTSHAPNSLLTQVSQEAAAIVYGKDNNMDGTRPPSDGPRREFWIVSDISGKVVDICGEKTSADAKVILYERNPHPRVKNQLWYLDTDGFIRSCLNDFVFLSAEKGKPLKTAEYIRNPRSQWMISDKKIFNRTGECLEAKIKKLDDVELICSQNTGSAGQNWTIQYHT